MSAADITRIGFTQKIGRSDDVAHHAVAAGRLTVAGYACLFIAFTAAWFCWDGLCLARH